MRKLFGLFTGLLLTAHLGYAQSPDSFQKQWEQADSLLMKGLPKSAIQQAEHILKAAQAGRDIPNTLKAQIFILNASADNREDFFQQAIAQSETYIRQTEGVQRAIWQGITANYYWQYYQNHRYDILSRTAIAEDTSRDFTTWDAGLFVKKVSSLYRQALLPAAQLQQTPAGDFAPLLIAGKHTDHLKPTMFDILARTALDFLQNQESGLPQPEVSFELSDGKGFLPAEAFVSAGFSSVDSHALSFQALKVYQQLLAFHLQQKDNPEGLVYADRQRLDFVYDHSVNPDKDSLYLQALSNIAAAYPHARTTAEVKFRMADLLYRMTTQAKAPGTTETKKRDLPAIRKQLATLVQDYPGTEGAAHAQNLINTLDKKELSLQTEEVYLPHQAVKALLTYQNLNTVYLRIYRVKNTENMEAIGDFYSSSELSERFMELIHHSKPLQAWALSLKGAQDMETHSTEFKIDALPTGRYYVVASGKKDIQEKDTDNHVVVASFQVSGLSVIGNAGGGTKESELWVLNRSDGQPVVGATITFWEQVSDKRGIRYEQKGTATSGDDGRVNRKSNSRRYNLKLSVVKGSDTLLVRDYLYDRSYDNDKKTQAYTFFFTDRSIYRPGQTIYFKGIMLEHQNGTSESQVLADKASTVTFYDVNRQKIASVAVKTNAFGSFSGTFKAPESGLTGRMSISNGTGTASVSVEEYKRPKFYVDFDTLKGDFSVGEPVKVKGFAKAYAGNNIEGATVQYHVVRRARFPYPWLYYRWGLPSSPQKEIAHGTVQTLPDGSFSITFTAVPDKSISPETLPLFSYEVSVDVTDINGETRSGAQMVQAGYRSMQIVEEAPEEGFIADMDSIAVTTQNLNGVFLPADLQVSVQKLRFPGKIYRKRMWPVPDQQLLSEKEFHQYFPDDEYEHESDYHYWEPEAVLFSKTIHTTPDGKVALPKHLWKKEGWYVLTFKGKDTKGRDVEQKTYTYIVIPKQQPEQPMSILAERSTYQPGEQAKIWLETGFQPAHLLGVSSLKGDFNQTGWLKHTVSEEDRGGIGFSWLYVYNNRVYQATQSLAVPWTNKELHIEWGTHRDKLLPGAQETWHMTIKGSHKEKVAAELLAGMYDASLDAFQPHQWDWDKLLPGLNFYPSWATFDYSSTGGVKLQTPNRPAYASYQQIYPQLDFGIGSMAGYYARVLNNTTLYGSRSGNAPLMIRGFGSMGKSMPDANLSSAPMKSTVKFTPPVIKEDAEEKPSPESPVQVRKNLQETAFFFPQLHTDEQGNITFSFTLPEALTRWKFMAFAHTKDWQTSYLEGSVQTQKELMLQPNLPRLLRQGDDLELTTKVVNLSDKDLQGTASLEILNALTNQPMDVPFRLQQQEQAFQAAKGRSTSISWKIHVPESVYQPVIIRIIAKAGHFSDGEENPLPVLSNRMLVTETLPLPVKGTGKHNFRLEKLLRSQEGADAATLLNHRLTVEFTGNPAWYAVQALPYLMEYPYECSEQTFSRFYANALAEHIVQQSPKVAEIFKQWEQGDTTALLSNLEKNQELKSALLEETPWVLEAQSETEQKHRIALLFQAHKIARGLDKNLRQLEAMQLSDGAFPWFTGMRANRYITQYILSGLGRLQHLGVNAAQKNTVEKVLKKGLPYTDAALQKDYDDLLKSKANLKDKHLSYTQVQYLYLRSFFLKEYPVAQQYQKAFAYYRKQAAQYWAGFNPYMKAMLALALNRMGESQPAQQIIASLSETAVQHPELGMYWKNMSGGYYWYQSAIESQSLIIAAFTEIGNHPDEIADMKTWLLKNKQTTNWQTTTATSDAIYALLLSGGDWLSYKPDVLISLGTKQIDLSGEKTQAGTGYFKETIPGKDVRSEMGNISVTVNNTGHSEDVPVSWGAVYWQYFQDMDKISAAQSPLHIEKELFIERNTATGKKLTRITNGNTLHVGDKVTVRIILKSDRDMDYVHLKDMRAATFEPTDVISGYRYQSGLGYYQSTLDASTNFFFDRLPKGTHVLEYTVFVGQKGAFSNGISTVQCMYAPEFGSHSAGLNVKVE